MKFKTPWFLVGIMLFAVPTVYAQQSIPLKGTLNIADGKFLINLQVNQKDPLRLEVKPRSDEMFDLQLSVPHWKSKYSDVSTILDGYVKIISGEGASNYFIGQLHSQYTLINNHPFEGPEIDFLLRDRQLVIRSFQLGPFSAFGKVYLLNKPTLDITVRFSQVSLADIGAVFQKGRMIDGEGKAEGEINFYGPLDQLQIRGGLDSYDGFIGVHEYNTAKFRFEGVYPLIHISDSYIAQPDGLSFDLKGTLDLSKSETFENQIRDFVKAPLISEDRDKMEWTFKRLRSDEKPGTTEFKYMIKGSTSGEETGILGVEQHMEF